MEKLQYLCWPRIGLDPPERGTLVRDAIVPKLLALRPAGLSIQVDDADAQVPVPMPPPDDEPQPFLLVSIWLDRYDDRAPYEAVLNAECDEIAGYLVTESMYTDYGGNRHSGPRNWADGERSPGVVMVTLLRRPATMSSEDWIAHWHGVQSPVSESMQPRMRYVRNAVARPITAGAPPIEGIVEEAWPSPEHMTDPMLFYCADGDADLMRSNLSAMLDSVTAFLDLAELRSFTTSEYLLKT
ncbi:MAG: hypothetical protein JJE46_01425 [Acidimicrobiia bacterium]|nr:hypothetical protein [Acidimicrobiia bacterium]